MTTSCSDICELVGNMMLSAGFKLPPDDQDWGSEEHRALEDALLSAHIYQEARPLVNVKVEVIGDSCAITYVRVNGSMILMASMDPRIVDSHWPGSGKRKKRYDCAVRLYWGPAWVSGDRDRSKSIHQVRAWMKRVGADDTEFVKAAQELGWEDELIFTEEELQEEGIIS